LHTISPNIFPLLTDLNHFALFAEMPIAVLISPSSTQLSRQVSIFFQGKPEKKPLCGMLHYVQKYRFVA